LEFSEDSLSLVDINLSCVVIIRSWSRISQEIATFDQKKPKKTKNKKISER
jgi:hypothetical protein